MTSWVFLSGKRKVEQQKPLHRFDSYKILLNDKGQQALIVNCATEVKSAIYNFVVYRVVEQHQMLLAIVH